jgi:2-polyprenyl-6-methoxyphenol hydroxylase-like FAD-dependent oxidoreductase
MLELWRERAGDASVKSYRLEQRRSAMTTNAAAARQIRTRCCVVGGGPAGMMLGFLLARGGIEVTVLEKHADFLRDFRGDTIHPSTLEIMHELGLLEDFLRRPHSELREIKARIGNVEVTMGDFSHLPTRCKFVAMMPQWDFLDFLAGAGRRYSGFRLEMSSSAEDLIEEGGQTVGVRAATAAGALEVRADLVVAADGRHSTLRRQARLAVADRGAPMDVLWLQLSRRPGDAKETFGRFSNGRIMVVIDRGDYWQCAFVIRKGAADETRARGLAAFRQEIAGLVPAFADRVDEIADWDQVKLLTVAVDHLRRWYRPGLLCIGDAAHAMSPIGGVGINLAIQDAVAAANILVPALRRGAVPLERLRAVQRRRAFPTWVTQRLQVMAQNRVIDRALGGSDPRSLPLPLRLMRRWPVLRRIPARLIGLGVRPEHVRS